MDSDFRITPEDLTIAKKLYEKVMETVVGFGVALHKVYVDNWLGGGIFKPRKMSQAMQLQTLNETIVFIAAFASVLLGKWPTRPSGIRGIMAVLEGALFEAQTVNLRSQYERYLQEYEVECQKGSVIFQPEGSLRSYFTFRLFEIWSFYELNTSRSSRVSNLLFELAQKVEADLRNALNEVWRA
jgi:hypothetical protein